MKFISKILLNTPLTQDIIMNILNIHYNSRWFNLFRKVNIRIKVFGFKVLNILGEPYKMPLYFINGYDKKDYYLKHSTPLIPKSIKFIRNSIKYSGSDEFISYKLKAISDNKKNIYVTFYNNGAVIWDNNKPRMSISGR